MSTVPDGTTIGLALGPLTSLYFTSTSSKTIFSYTWTENRIKEDTTLRDNVKDLQLDQALNLNSAIE